MRSVELFAGAGGLAIGMANAGFEHAALLEWNHDACETIRANRKSYDLGASDWHVVEGDVRAVNFRTLASDIEVISGGPPCQPFSLGGKANGPLDERDMFPQAVRAVREMAPKAFIFENVKGLLRESFSSYFQYVLLQLRYPEITSRKGESWPDHLGRLGKHDASTGKKARKEGLTYSVEFKHVNAANFGVPQKRDRVFIVGFRSDLGIEWKFPEATHSREALLHAQWVTGEYWDRHKLSSRKRPLMPEGIVSKLERAGGLVSLNTLPWLTVRDAISGLPDPTKRSALVIQNHVHNPGARVYPGHTGSPLDEPSKALKAGGHGVPGGENMLRDLDGSVRYFTVREASRIQTFPDSYVFMGPWSEAMRQLGNAVPVKLAESVARSVHEVLKKKPSK